MWALYSTKDFNRIANERTKERKEVTDWAAWTAKMKQAADESTDFKIAVVAGDENERAGISHRSNHFSSAFDRDVFPPICFAYFSWGMSNFANH